MKYRSYLINLIVALVLIFALMMARGFFSAEGSAEMLLIAADSFTAIAFIFVGIGALVWISSTGFFDIFGYAFKWSAHALIPGLFRLNAENFYEYKLEQKEKSHKGYGGMLVVGIALLLISGVLVLLWYKASGNL